VLVDYGLLKNGITYIAGIAY